MRQTLKTFLLAGVLGLVGLAAPLGVSAAQAQGVAVVTGGYRGYPHGGHRGHGYPHRPHHRPHHRPYPAWYRYPTPYVAPGIGVYRPMFPYPATGGVSIQVVPPLGSVYRPW
ncbi:MAG: hypothetical protein U0794_01945 [Isosphaeraceae bacterium]